MSKMIYDEEEWIKKLDQLHLDQEPKEIYSKGYADGQRALAEHIELCKEEQEPTVKAIPLERVEQIREHFEAIAFFNGTVKADYVLRMLDKAIKEVNE